MKTIEEAAKEHVKDVFQQLSFQAGVQFAQRWIPVEEEQPELDKKDEWNKDHGISDRVLAMEDGKIYFGRFNHHVKSWTLEGRPGNIHPQFWRPIELQ